MKLKSLFLSGLLVMSIGMIVMIYPTGQVSASKVYTTNPSVRGSWAGHWKGHDGTYYEKLRITKYTVKSKEYFQGKFVGKSSLSGKNKGYNRLITGWNGSKDWPKNYWMMAQATTNAQWFVRKTVKNHKVMLKTFHFIDKGGRGAIGYYYHHKF